MITTRDTLNLLRDFRKTLQMYFCTVGLVAYAFTDLLTELQGDVTAYLALAGLAGYTVRQTVEEKKIQKSEYNVQPGNEDSPAR